MTATVLPPLKPSATSGRNCTWIMPNEHFVEHAFSDTGRKSSVRCGTTGAFTEIVLPAVDAVNTLPLETVKDGVPGPRITLPSGSIGKIWSRPVAPAATQIEFDFVSVTIVAGVRLTNIRPLTTPESVIVGI